jgi:hypothetical protein
MTNKENITDKMSAVKGSGNLPKAYIRLRTVLDAMETSALRYCLIDANAAETIKRAKEIETLLMPIITRLQKGGCEDGLFNCGGCCLPHPCLAEMM